MAPEEEDLDVSVIALSGETIIELTLPRQTYSEDLYDLAGSSFEPGTNFKLAYEDKVLRRDMDQPLRSATSPAILSFTAGWHGGSRTSPQGSFFLDGGGLCNLVRRGRHKLAHILMISDRRKELSMESEFLSWIAYTSGGARQGNSPNGRAMPGALRLLWDVILREPRQVRRRDPQTGKLPLHDAAWGHSPIEAAVMIAAAFPLAIQDRQNRSLESPVDVGRYCHRKFSWPEAEELKARALRLRRLGQLMAPLRTLKTHRQVGLRGCLDEGLNLGLVTGSTTIATYLTDCQDLIHSGLIPSTVLTLCSTAALSTSSTPSTSSPQQPLPKALDAKHGADVPSIETKGPCREKVKRKRSGIVSSCDGIDHLREHFVKDAGLYGGAHRVRNRRCSFVEVSELLVDGKRFKLETHVSHTVHSSVQRSAPAKNWPCKTLWQKERLKDRRERAMVMAEAPQ